MKPIILEDIAKALAGHEWEVMPRNLDYPESAASPQGLTERKRHIEQAWPEHVPAATAVMAVLE